MIFCPPIWNCIAFSFVGFEGYRILYSFLSFICYCKIFILFHGFVIFIFLCFLLAYGFQGYWIFFPVLEIFIFFNGFCVGFVYFCCIMTLWIFRQMALQNWSKSSLMLDVNNGFLEVTLCYDLPFYLEICSYIVFLYFDESINYKKFSSFFPSINVECCHAYKDFELDCLGFFPNKIYLFLKLISNNALYVSVSFS